MAWGKPHMQTRRLTLPELRLQCAIVLSLLLCGALPTRAAFYTIDRVLPQALGCPVFNSTGSQHQLNTASSGSNDTTVVHTCSQLPAGCFANCTLNGTTLSSTYHGCAYGRAVQVLCTPLPGIECKEGDTVTRNATCQYCYQTQPFACENSTDCDVYSPNSSYLAKCVAKPDVLCLGHRVFPKMRECDWTSGRHWTSNLLYSLTIGGLGADRLYLDQIGWGIFKLFSFGGLGLWAIVDAVLSAVGFLHPGDGSLLLPS